MKSFIFLPCRFARIAGAFLLGLLFLIGDAHAHVVASWNRALAQHASTLPAARRIHVEARMFAMMHLAMAEAVADAARGTRNSQSTDAAQSAAAVAAAQDIVTDLLPAAQAEAGALAGQQLAAIPDGPEKSRGLACGHAAASHLLSRRATDGWTTLGLLEGTTGLLPDRSEALARAVAAGSEPPRSRWLAIPPFYLKSAEQMNAPVPAFLATDGSVRKNTGLIESKFFNLVDRTLPGGMLQQTWSERPVPAWNRVARAVAESRGLPLVAQVRLFAVLNAALADATLSVQHARYWLGTWNAMFVDKWVDGRDVPMRASDTTAPAVFDGLHHGVVLLETRRVLIPPMDNYPSIAATLAGAAEAAMKACLKSDESGFTLEIPTNDAESVRRTYGSVADAARECAFVATLDGRHTREAGIAGHELGTAVGREVARRFQRGRR